MLNIMQSMFDYIIIDAGQSLDNMGLETLKMSDQIFIVSILSVPCLSNTKKLLKSLESEGVPLATPTTVTVTVVGLNDAPVATANSGTVTEDIALTASGNVLTDDDGAGIDSDVDTGDVLSVSDIRNNFV